MLAQVHGVIEPRQGWIIVGAGRAGRRAGQVFVTGNQFLINIIDLVINAPGTVVGKSVQGHIGHIGAEGAVHLGQAGGNGACRGQQRAVISGVGGFATVPISAHAAGEHQQHQQ